MDEFTSIIFTQENEYDTEIKYIKVKTCFDITDVSSFMDSFIKKDHTSVCLSTGEDFLIDMPYEKFKKKYYSAIEAKASVCMARDFHKLIN